MKKNFSISINYEVLDKIRDIVYWTPGISVSGLIENCLVNLINAMEQERGEQFPKRTGQLHIGRPLKS